MTSYLVSEKVWYVGFISDPLDTYPNLTVSKTYLYVMILKIADFNRQLTPGSDLDV
jgi:hypothetical protein